MLLIIILIFMIVIILPLWCCCKVAGDSDNSKYEDSISIDKWTDD